MPKCATSMSDQYLLWFLEMDKGDISWPEPFIFGMVTIEFLDTGDETRMLILLNIYVYTCYSASSHAIQIINTKKILNL